MEPKYYEHRTQLAPNVVIVTRVDFIQGADQLWNAHTDIGQTGKSPSDALKRLIDALRAVADDLEKQKF